MPELGRKYTCYSCHTKFYDLGKPTPICPKCGADQRDAEEAPVTTSSRSRRAPVIEEPADEPEFEAEPEAGPVAVPDSEDEEEIIAPAEREEEPEEEEEEEEY
ncbi:MAG: FYDLN acid domain-containing protein [Thermoanaerobaculia bacterium]